MLRKGERITVIDAESGQRIFSFNIKDFYPVDREKFKVETEETISPGNEKMPPQIAVDTDGVKYKFHLEKDDSGKWWFILEPIKY
jgi:hypothetical protein